MPMRIRYAANLTLTCAALCLAFPSIAQTDLTARPAATARGTEEGAHLAAIVDFLQALEEFDALSRDGLIRYFAAGDPGQVELATRYVDAVYPDWWIRETGVEAGKPWLPYLSRDDAETAARYFRSPAGQKHIQTGRARSAGTPSAAPVFTPEEAAQERDFFASPVAVGIVQHMPEVNRAIVPILVERVDGRVLQLRNAAGADMVRWPSDRLEAEVLKLKGGKSMLAPTDQMGLVYAYISRAVDGSFQRLKARADDLSKTANQISAQAKTPAVVHQAWRDYYVAWNKAHAQLVPEFLDMADLADKCAANVAAPRSVRLPWQNGVHEIVQRRVAYIRSYADTAAHVAAGQRDVEDYLDRARSRRAVVNGKLVFDDPAEQRRFDELEGRVDRFWSDFNDKQAQRQAERDAAIARGAGS